MKINQIRPQEAEFTKVLSAIALMPKILYYNGKIPEKRVPSVAIVGARKHTSYGQEVAYQAAYELAKRGVAIISGLAIGIDSVAHRAALDAGGLTLAVLGTPIDQIYPARHFGLAEEIIEKGGAVLSEYAPGTPLNYKRSFLERNRIISGLADAVLIVEAGKRSGTLNTAMHALDQGREVLAVPGDITRPISVGCNRLISQGAYPYTEPADVLKVLGLEESRSAKKAPSGDNELETAILSLIAGGERDGAQILQKLKLTVADFNQAITLLEIKGRVLALGANQWGLGN